MTVFYLTDVSGDKITAFKHEIAVLSQTSPKTAHYEAFVKNKTNWEEETSERRGKLENEGYEVCYDHHFLECRTPDIWTCLTSVQFVHMLWRYCCDDDKTLVTHQDLNDSMSSKGELEWLAWMEQSENISLKLT